MYAIIRTGGKQYRVAEGDTVFVERDILASAEDGNVTFSDVLMIGGDNPVIGAPLVANAAVRGEIIREFRADKIIVFKKKRTKMYKRKQGHRQDLVAVRVGAIES